MKKIFKYKLVFDDNQTISIPQPAGILSVIEQDGELMLYAVVEDDPIWEYQKYNIYIRGTGHTLYDAEYAVYIGTVKMPNGLVWHVFYSRVEG